MSRSKKTIERFLLDALLHHGYRIARAFRHRFRHHFSHAWLDRGTAGGDLMELNGWTSLPMLRRYGASARAARARRSYDRIMGEAP
jgi:hypothetical protein